MMESKLELSSGPRLSMSLAKSFFLSICFRYLENEIFYKFQSLFALLTSSAVIPRDLSFKIQTTDLSLISSLHQTMVLFLQQT